MSIVRVQALSWETDIANAIADRDLQADTTFGPIRDIIAKPVSKVADRINQDIVQLSDILSLTNVSQFTIQDLDDVAYNSQIVRGGGAPATATVSLLSSSPPVSDVTLAINFPFSTDPDPSTGATVYYASTQQVQFIAANSGNYYDAVNRVYRLDVPVAAVLNGVIGNVGPNRIVQTQRSIGGFQRIVNFAGAVGGEDSESNDDLASTLLIFNLGINDISTPYGIGLETKRQFPGIVDYKVVYGSDPLITRASFDAGATDVYLIGSSALATSNSFIYAGQPVPLVLLKQPVLSIVSVVSGATTFVAGTHYSFVPDTGPYGGSVQGRDAVLFLPTSPLFPAIGDTVTVTYNYNAFIATVQSFFESPKFKVDGRSLLYKQGLKKFTSIAGNLTVLSGFDPAAVKANVITAILAFVNALKLGEPLEQFDLLTAIGIAVGSAGGVDNLVLTQLNLQGVSGVLSQIPATQGEYLRAEITDVVITPV